MNRSGYSCEQSDFNNMDAVVGWLEIEAEVEE